MPELAVYKGVGVERGGGTKISYLVYHILKFKFSV